MPLRNLPMDVPVPLSSLVHADPGRVVSRSLTAATDGAEVEASMTLLAFAAGEDVSEEVYFGDTLYYLVEGAAAVSLPDRVAELLTGDCLMVPAGVEHALLGRGAFKVLQITVP